MVIKIGGFRKRTRHKLKKGIREKGKVSLSRYFQEFAQGEVVVLKAEPAVQKGMYFPRFHGRKGTVVGKQGNSYIVSILDGKVEKRLFVHPVHLRREGASAAIALAKKSISSKPK